MKYYREEQFVERSKESAISKTTASKVYTDVMYTLTLNIFYDLILEYEMPPHHQEADEDQDGLSDCLFLQWCDLHLIIKRQMTSTGDGC